ncbi:MAG: hypothetical protein ABJG28_14840, partial [Nonlabens ulvanivorans]|uniref:hypothetical protein n=1 Tax=Nonlabens ulvanivorans TaxID=906888 RepID=UPI0032652364
MKVHWLQSDIRQTFLTYRFYNFPLLFGNKPIADVYLSLNDPHSFMLIQVLSELESRFNLTFRLYLVTNTTLSSEVDAELLNQWALKDANFIAQKYGLMTVSSFPEMKTLVTGQQTWLLHGKTVKQALKVFVDTWSNNFEEDFPISTPVITAQINNQRRMFRRCYYTSVAIFFCGNWFSGVDRLEYLERLLNEKGLSKEAPRLTYTKNNLALSDSYVASGQEDAIQAFISLDSPFAYLGLVQAKRLSEHYKIPIEIKPLVSMDMRGGVTPEHKQRYMLLDAI